MFNKQRPNVGLEELEIGRRYRLFASPGTWSAFENDQHRSKQRRSQPRAVGNARRSSHSNALRNQIEVHATRIVAGRCVIVAADVAFVEGETVQGTV